MRRTKLAASVLVLALAACTPPARPWPAWQSVLLPLRPESVRFAVIGDSGTGGRAQYEVAARMAEMRERFPFGFVLMLGDNLYGGAETPDDFARKFEQPYAPLLSAGVKFYAVLGNHDETTQRSYRLFNMGGERYYSFHQGPAQFFALDSNYMDPEQLAWLERELEGSTAAWRIVFMHHPLYSSGRHHGSEIDLRRLLEPLFVAYGVNVVFAGHEHFYERIHPQHGIRYFTSGGAAKLTRGGFHAPRRGESVVTELGYDRDRQFMLIEIDGDVLTFQAVTRAGRTIDRGAVRRTETLHAAPHPQSEKPTIEKAPHPPQPSAP